MPKKPKSIKIDGEISADEIDGIRKAIRQQWGWKSVARKNCIRRATDKNGFGHCENPDCKKKKVPKLLVDHIQVMGDVLAPDYIKRMWCHSSKLQALCKKCHDKKTNKERATARKLKEERNQKMAKIKAQRDKALKQQDEAWEDI